MKEVTSYVAFIRPLSAALLTNHHPTPPPTPDLWGRLGRPLLTWRWLDQVCNVGLCTLNVTFLLFPGPVWVRPDSRRWGGQRHPQSSAPVKPVRPRPASCLPPDPRTQTPILPCLFSLWWWWSRWRTTFCFSICPSGDCLKHKGDVKK